MADVISNPAFQRLSSPLGNSGSPFDKALCNRDKIVFDYYSRKVATAFPVALEYATEVLADCEAVFPGMGGFASGGGPLS